MKNDPIVDEIHRGRREHAAKFGHDIYKIIADLKSREGASGHPVVQRQPRRIPRQAARQVDSR
jgi:hypothetical protein